MHSQKVSIAVVYKPLDDREFFSLLERHIQYLKKRRKNILIMGDLNSDLLSKKNHMEKG